MQSTHLALYVATGYIVAVTEKDSQERDTFQAHSHVTHFCLFETIQSGDLCIEYRKDHETNYEQKK